MTDIVERLRDQGKDAFAKHYSLGMFKLCADAADEIERLRNAAQSAWQPIATAPIEIEILGCWSKSGVMGVVVNYRGNWEENDSPVSSPDHWMPLPAVPALSSAQCKERE